MKRQHQEPNLVAEGPVQGTGSGAMAVEPTPILSTTPLTWMVLSDLAEEHSFTHAVPAVLQIPAGGQSIRSGVLLVDIDPGCRADIGGPAEPASIERRAFLPFVAGRLAEVPEPWKERITAAQEREILNRVYFAVVKPKEDQRAADYEAYERRMAQGAP